MIFFLLLLLLGLIMPLQMMIISLLLILCYLISPLMLLVHIMCIEYIIIIIYTTLIEIISNPLGIGIMLFLISLFI
jgi:hypothetical protein